MTVGRYTQQHNVRTLNWNRIKTDAAVKNEKFYSSYYSYMRPNAHPIMNESFLVFPDSLVPLKKEIVTDIREDFLKLKGKLPCPVSHYRIIEPEHTVQGEAPTPDICFVSKDSNVVSACHGIVSGISEIPGAGMIILVMNGNYIFVYSGLRSACVKEGDEIKTKEKLGVLRRINGVCELSFQVWKGQNKEISEDWLECSSKHGLHTGRAFVGDSIQGDWIGNKKGVSGKLIRSKEGVGNPVDGGTQDEWTIVFSSNEMKPFPIGCCDAVLINEGDLNSDGADELSIYQAPLNGCAHRFTTYTFRNGYWKVIIEPFLIPGGCDGWNADELQERVVKEGGGVYLYLEDPNDKLLRKIKKRILLITP
jgi:hypothetical protein